MTSIKKFKFTLLLSLSSFLFSCNHNDFNGTWVQGNRNAIEIEGNEKDGFSVFMSENLLQEHDFRNLVNNTGLSIENSYQNERTKMIMKGAGIFHLGNNKNEILYDNNTNITIVFQNGSLLFREKLFTKFD